MAESNEVQIRVAQDDDATRIIAVLEALGYAVTREQPEDGDATRRMKWAADQLARRHRLTFREQEILALVLDGSTNGEISNALNISRATIKWHMHNIFAKTITRNRESLLRLALAVGGG